MAEAAHLPALPNRASAVLLPLQGDSSLSLYTQGDALG